MNAVTGQYNSAAVPSYVTGVSYAPSGAMSQVNLGLVKVQSFCYNNRLQMTGIRVGSAAESRCQMSGTPDLTLGLGYGTGNNGNVMSQSIRLGSTLLATQVYTYDALNRLKAATETKGNRRPAWSQTFVYDRYGNRAMLASSTPAPATGVPQVTADDPAQVTARLATYTDPVSGSTVVKNQWLGSTMDAAGNVKAFTSSTYPTNLTYDAENRLVSAQTGKSGTMAAEYGGEGRRVKRTANGVDTVYVHDAMGRLAQEYGGGPDSAAGRQYFIADHLGSTRLTLSDSGVVQSRSDYLPFGQEIESGLGDRTLAQGYQSRALADVDRQRMRFTGKERDAETGLDYFGARYFSGAQGRFTSPDPLLASGRAEDPQSWNRYAYGRNNLLRFIDPTGLDYYDQNGNRIGAGGDGSNYVVTDEEEIKRLRASKTAVALNSLSSTTLLPDPTVVAALNDAVARSNSPTQDDPKGGFHEEGGQVGLDASGARVVVPAAAGAADRNVSQPNVSIAIGVPANPADAGRIVSPQVGFHIHPSGQIQTTTGPAPGTVFGDTVTINTRNFNQPPSDVDRANAVYPMNIVVGARNRTVYFYNQGGVTATFPLNRLTRLR